MVHRSIIAYSHCIAHGYDMAMGLDQQKKAVLSGYWPLMRYNPALAPRRQEPLPPRFQGAQYSAEAIRLSGSTLHHAGSQRSRSRARTAESWRRTMWNASGASMPIALPWPADRNRLILLPKRRTLARRP